MSTHLPMVSETYDMKMINRSRDTEFLLPTTEYTAGGDH